MDITLLASFIDREFKFTPFYQVSLLRCGGGVGNFNLEKKN